MLPHMCMRINLNYMTVHYEASTLMKEFLMLEFYLARIENYISFS